LFGGPRRHAEVAAAILRVERLEIGTDLHVLVGAGVVRTPDLVAIGHGQREDPPSHSQFTARVADDDLVLHDERRHRHRLTDVDIADFGAPGLLARRGIDRHRLRIEGVEDHFALCKRGAAIDDVAAGDTHCPWIGIRLVLPLERAVGLRQVDRQQDVRIRRHDVHRAVHDERIAFVPVRDARLHDVDDLHARGIAGVDLRERAVARIRQVAVRQAPFARRHGRDEMGIVGPGRHRICVVPTGVRVRSLRGRLVVGVATAAGDRGRAQRHAERCLRGPLPDHCHVGYTSRDHCSV
jgi:hypothetical protein